MPNTVTHEQLEDRDGILRQLKLLRSLMTTTGRKPLADEADRLFTETLDLGMAYADLKTDIFAFTAEVRMNLRERRSLL